MLDKFEIYISVIAALVSELVSIYQRATLFEMSVRMIVIIISFYIIGLIVKAYLKKKVFPEPEKLDDPSNETGDTDEIPGSPGNVPEDDNE